MRFERFSARVILLMASFGLLSGCGGGSSSDASAPSVGGGIYDDGSTAPFGLTERRPLGSLFLPTDSVDIGSYRLEASFPQLVFFHSIFVAGVPGENRLVVLRQSGQLEAFVNDTAASSTRLILDLAGIIVSGGEEGLLGLAFDPGFVTNRFVYVHYSAGGPRRSVISRFSWDTVLDRVELFSEKVILEVEQPFSNHNGGMLAFGPDDYLYVALGDGGSGGDPQNNAQNPDNFLGSILRLDVHPSNPFDPYQVPADNPFVGQNGFRPETYAYGLRNPFRFSFDRQTGDLWVGDVGQNEREEIDLVRAGDNLGWRVFEGNLPYDGSLNNLPAAAFVPPVIDYDHGQGVAVIGGYVYRGTRNPGLVGRYLYTDLVPGPVWALEYDGVNVRANDVIVSTTAGTNSFGEGNDGEVYLLQSDSIFHFVETANGGRSLPERLSETGIFSSLADLTPASGLIEFAVNQPFWSDGALKRRFAAIPTSERIEFSATEPWRFPVGSLLVKHFELELTEGIASSARRLETRLLIRTVNGWQGFTYRWNDDQNDALLLSGRAFENITVALLDGGTREQVYEYPSRTDCLTCHNDSAGFALGAKARQLNGDFAYPAAIDNQLRSWNNIALFTSDIGDPEQYGVFPAVADSAASLDARARAYLSINCASCHQPGGPTPVSLDLSFGTPLVDTGALDTAPSAGDLGLASARIIAPGDRARSVLWERMRRLDGDRMPPVGSHVVDELGVALIGDWIDTL